MKQLFRHTGPHYERWSSGCAPFFVGWKSGPWRLPLAVRCRLGASVFHYLALLDTGAEWSVISEDTAAIIPEGLGAPTETFSMSTRLGKISGALHRVEINLVAESGCGRDLSVESSVFVSEQWDGPIVLGYRGFLERIRFAFDPGVVPDDQFFYFGVAE